MSHEAVRLKRLDIIRRLIKNKMKLDDIVHDCCIRWGCSRRTMLEYLKILKQKKVTPNKAPV